MRAILSSCWGQLKRQRSSASGCLASLHAPETRRSTTGCATTFALKSSRRMRVHDVVEFVLELRIQISIQSWIIIWEFYNDWKNKSHPSDRTVWWSKYMKHLKVYRLKHLVVQKCEAKYQKMRQDTNFNLFFVNTLHWLTVRKNSRQKYLKVPYWYFKALIIWIGYKIYFLK